jgi:hypothetical protein
MFSMVYVAPAVTIRRLGGHVLDTEFRNLISSDPIPCCAGCGLELR